MWPSWPESQGQDAALLTAGQARPETIFDLASLTKPLATSLLLGRMLGAQRLTLATSLHDLWGQAVPQDKRTITIAQLMAHCAGFAAHRPYHTILEQQPPAMRRPLLKAMLMNEPLVHTPGSRAIYSDLGYLLLGLILEHLGRQRQDQIWDHACAEMNLDAPRFLPSDQPLPWPKEQIAPCGRDSWAVVQDQNAAALTGVAGHAGLFGTARQTAAALDALLSLPLAGQFCAPDQDTPGSTRTLAFDTPSGEQSAAGKHPPAGAVGHTGYTGASLWRHPPPDAASSCSPTTWPAATIKKKSVAYAMRLHTLAWDLF